MSDARLTVGYVAGVHGIRGAVKVRLHDPASVALQAGTVVSLWRDGAHVGDHEVARASEARAGELRVELADVRDRDAADRLRGCEVRVDRAALPPLQDDEYYLADLVGAVVERATAGGTRQALGIVVGVTTNGPQDLLEVEWTDPGGARHAWLLPALPGFVLETAPGRVLADPPPGFLPDALEGEDA